MSDAARARARLDGGSREVGLTRALGTMRGDSFRVKKGVQEIKADSVQCCFPKGPVSAFNMQLALESPGVTCPQKSVSGHGGTRVLTPPFPDHRVRVL